MDWKVKQIYRECKDFLKECCTSADTFEMKIPENLNSLDQNEARYFGKIFLGAAIANDINHYGSGSLLYVIPLNMVTIGWVIYYWLYLA